MAAVDHPLSSCKCAFTDADGTFMPGESCAIHPDATPQRAPLFSNEKTLVERLVALAEAERDVAYSVDMPPEKTANWGYALTALQARDEIERLRGEAEVADEQIAQLLGFAEEHHNCAGPAPETSPPFQWKDGLPYINGVLASYDQLVTELRPSAQETEPKCTCGGSHVWPDQYDPNCLRHRHLSAQKESVKHLRTCNLNYIDSIGEGCDCGAETQESKP